MTLAAMPSPAASAGYLTQWGCGGGLRSVAVPQGGEPVYVGDGQTVTQYSASGQRLRVFEPAPTAPFAFPVVAPSSDGVWVGSYADFPRIERYSPSGSRLAAWGPASYTSPEYFQGGYFRGVSALVGGEIQGREVVVVVDMHGSPLAFDTNGTPLGHLLVSQNLGEVVGVAISQGVLFVLSNHGHLSNNGGQLFGFILSFEGGKLTVARVTRHQLDGPKPTAIAAAPGGLWLRLIDAAELTSIQKISFRGDPVAERYTERDVPGGLSDLMPRATSGAHHYAGIAADSAGNVYAADAGRRIVKLGPAGALRATGGGPGSPRLDDCDRSPPTNLRRDPTATSPDRPLGRSWRPRWFAPRRLDPIGERRLRFRVDCAGDCGATVSGTLVAGRRRLRLRPAHRSIRGGRIASVTLRIPRRAVAIARRGLRRRQRVTLAIRLHVTEYATGEGYSSAARLRLTRTGARIAAAPDRRLVAIRER